MRSHFAKFHMRAMSVGDGVLFYHSSCEPPGVAGLARVSKTGVVDETQFDPDSQYYDPKSKREAPTWDCVEVELVEKLPRFVALAEIRADTELAKMLLLKRGMRLSVQPVTAAEYATRMVALGERSAPARARGTRRSAACASRRATRGPGARRGSGRPRRRARGGRVGVLAQAVT